MTCCITPAENQACLLYDGDCPLCQRSVAILRRLDWRGKVRYLNAREAANIPACEPPLKPERLLEEMHLITPNSRHVYHGFGAFRWLAWRLPPLWPLAPFLYVPGVPTLGQKIYLWIARHRFQLVPCQDGVCTLPPPQPAKEKESSRHTP
ncbi:MAG: thiol-disulfide oxidoreductase DCC family protein [Gemmataceae bacterium]